ncbi:MAG: UDP-N-acetylmuramoyl-L-alanine--D-glutamate ligase [Proteobacteria bacterium]|nr:UDP-N-acetylmuramoyl-L-alanine--D-glutamate ligase [Pseudomonadota bacterium]
MSATLKSTQLSAERLRSFSGQTIAVVGMGKSGQAAAKLALRLGAVVHCFDGNTKATAPPKSRAHFGPQEGIPKLSNIRPDLLIVSPGIPSESSWLAPFKDARIQIASELGFAAFFMSIPIIAVTGTNGKSSCCWYLKDLLEQAEQKVFIGGNFGTALCEAVLNMLEGQTYDCIIAEVSSYQMELPYSFHPKISILLNLTPDHLKRHGTMDEYARCKRMVFAEQNEHDWVIVDSSYPTLFPKTDHKSQLCLFGTENIDSTYGALISQTKISLNTKNKTTDLCTEPIKLLGSHNKSNIAAALLAVQALGLPIQSEHVYNLKPLIHRLEQVSSPQNIRWINDSKATNIEATSAALKALKERPHQGDLWIILGGAGKEGAQYQNLSEDLKALQAKIICFGATRFEISQSLQVSHLTETLNDVFNFLQTELCPKDTVLFSPACASFDQYRNFEERGEHFKHLVSTHHFTLSP